MGLIKKILGLVGCDHTEIYINGFREGAKADYRCVKCGKRIYPSRSSKNWVYESDGIYKDKRK